MVLRVVGEIGLEDGVDQIVDPTELTELERGDAQVELLDPRVLTPSDSRRDWDNRWVRLHNVVYARYLDPPPQEPGHEDGFLVTEGTSQCADDTNDVCILVSDRLFDGGGRDEHITVPIAVGRTSMQNSRTDCTILLGE